MFPSLSVVLEAAIFAITFGAQVMLGIGACFLAADLLEWLTRRRGG